MRPRRLEKYLPLAGHYAPVREPERTRLRSPVPPTISSSSMPAPKRAAAATLARHVRPCQEAFRAAQLRSENVRPPPDWRTALLRDLRPAANNRWPAQPIRPERNVEQELLVGSRRHQKTAARGHLLCSRAGRVAWRGAACHKPRPAPVRA